MRQGAGNNNGGNKVASQGILKYPGQLTIPKGYMLIADPRRKSINNIAQTRQ